MYINEILSNKHITFTCFNYINNKKTTNMNNEYCGISILNNNKYTSVNEIIMWLPINNRGR